MNLARPIFAASGLNPYKFDRDSNQECRSVPRQACEQVQRGMQCHQVILQLLHALSDSKHCLFAHSFALPKIWVNPVPENYPLMLQKKLPIYVAIIYSPHLFCNHPQKETEECKPLLQQKCHQVGNMIVSVWLKRFNGTNVLMLTKCTNTHQICKYSPNGWCSPNVQKHTKCANAHQMSGSPWELLNSGSATMHTNDQEVEILLF